MRPPPRRRRGRPREGVQPPLVQSHFGVRHGDPDAHERVLPAHARLGSTKASSKGELLASVSDVWFLIFLLVPILIVVFFGFTTVNQDLTISYSRLTGANYLGALDPFGPVATLFVRTLGVAFMAAVGSLVIAFPIAYYLARVCRERNRGLLVSLFVIPFWISFV